LETKDQDEILPQDEDEERSPAQNASNPFAGLGGSGGMPDLASLMNNPMIMQMAQQMMANGGLDNLMSNPALRNMADNFSRGGGLPNMNEMLNDPTLRNMAEQFGRGGGLGRGSGGR